MYVVLHAWPANERPKFENFTKNCSLIEVCHQLHVHVENEMTFLQTGGKCICHILMYDDMGSELWKMAAVKI